MQLKMNLRARIFLLLTGLVVIAVSSGGIMAWYNYRMQGLFKEIIDRNLAAFESAAALEIALVNQKGFVTYYFLDHDPSWLNQFDEYRKIFHDRLHTAQSLATSSAQKRAIERIAEDYSSYMLQKDRVIEHYKKGEVQKGAELHRSVRQLFFNIIALCEDYKLEQLNHISEARMEGSHFADQLRIFMITATVLEMFLSIGLAVLFVQQILTPVYKMLKSTNRNAAPDNSDNALTTLSRNVTDLLHTVDEAHHELEKSRENLLQAEKMALVGKLAAGMAHSIRNPFTSVKMRLFSLNRSLKLDSVQKEDFEVISQEIRHIDTIVQNFLEFSRPPKLVMQPISPSTIVDNALQLLSHRLDSYGVTVDVVRSDPLPEVMADPEQLKEVLVNLIINACEEMKSGGTIIIDEQVESQGGTRRAVLHISDNGPGISAANAEKIFQPFFTTKEEGTGLGLSIADRIVAEHGGALTLDADCASGATFIILLPLKE